MASIAFGEDNERHNEIVAKVNAIGSNKLQDLMTSSMEKEIAEGKNIRRVLVERFEKHEANKDWSHESDKSAMNELKELIKDSSSSWSSSGSVSSSESASREESAFEKIRRLRMNAFHERAMHYERMRLKKNIPSVKVEDPLVKQSISSSSSSESSSSSSESASSEDAKAVRRQQMETVNDIKKEYESFKTEFEKLKKNVKEYEANAGSVSREMIKLDQELVKEQRRFEWDVVKIQKAHPRDARQLIHLWNAQRMHNVEMKIIEGKIEKQSIMDATGPIHFNQGKNYDHYDAYDGNDEDKNTK